LQNPVAQRAVRIVAEGVAAAPLMDAGKALMQLVGATSAGQPLLETIAAQLLMHGNCYVQIVKDAAGRPIELFALRPERVAEDRLDVNGANFAAGEAPSVPLVEIREAA
jgi:phage portal protein BeeE